MDATEQLSRAAIAHWRSGHGLRDLLFAELPRLNSVGPRSGGSLARRSRRHLVHQLPKGLLGIIGHLRDLHFLRVAPAKHLGIATTDDTIRIHRAVHVSRGLGLGSAQQQFGRQLGAAAATAAATALYAQGAEGSLCRIDGERFVEGRQVPGREAGKLPPHRKRVVPPTHLHERERLHRPQLLRILAEDDRWPRRFGALLLFVFLAVVVAGHLPAERCVHGLHAFDGLQ
mmetsp:Transcript_82028/g.265794  ORF Transcript_82028/g.265794 Transcript_82028/m.265794 type:complete len:229 (-) Transcript_82028:1179-1865(-)